MKNLKWIEIVNFGILVVLLSFFLFSSVNFQTDMKDKTLELSESAKKDVAPDKSTVVLSIVSQNESLDVAVNENNEINNEIISYFEDKYEVNSKSYSVDEWSEWNNEEGKRETYGYRVYNTIEIETEKINDSGSIVSKSLELGANRIETVYFSLSDERKKEVEDELITEAIQNANIKAKDIAEASNVKLGEIQKIVPSSWSYGPVYREYASAGSADKAMSSASFAPDEQEVSMSVSITYRIE